MARKFYELLESSGRTGWVAEEMTALLDPSSYAITSREAWRRVKIGGPRPKTLAVLRALAEWREEEAMHRDIPPNWIVRNEALVEIAQSCPKDVKSLARVPALKPHVAKGRDGAAMLDCVARALASPKEDWPTPPPARARNSGHEPLFALLQALLQRRCEAHGVATSVAARRAELDRIAMEEGPDVPALTGWRWEVFGEDALALCAGRLALTA